MTSPAAAHIPLPGIFKFQVAAAWTRLQDEGGSPDETAPPDAVLRTPRRRRRSGGIGMPVPNVKREIALGGAFHTHTLHHPRPSNLRPELAQLQDRQTSE
jgi:hypothetical protein